MADLLCKRCSFCNSFVDQPFGIRVMLCFFCHSFLRRLVLPLPVSQSMFSPMQAPIPPHVSLLFLLLSLRRYGLRITFCATMNTLSTSFLLPGWLSRLLSARQALSIRCYPFPVLFPPHRPLLSRS